jgi:5S rRNA maturation endonuclease (ribonuclease M5)
MRGSIDCNYHVGEVKMWKNARKNKSVAIIVEGKSDELFFQKFLDINTTFFPVDGFEKVIDVVEKIENEIPFVIGIIDADFRHCTNEVLSTNRVFITDFHDVEMMIISSKAWDEVVGFHSQKTKLSVFQKKYSKTLREYLIEISSSIASIRFLNSQKKLGLVFKTL